MITKKMIMTALLGVGVFAFTGFTSVKAQDLTTNTLTLTEIENKPVEVITVNEDAPVEIEYGTELPLEQLLSVVKKGIVESHETFEYVGMVDVHKQKYVTPTSEILVSGYDAKNYVLKDIIVEVNKKTNLIKEEVKKYRVLVNIKDKTAPDISLKSETVELTEGDEYDLKSNVEKVHDKEDGDITEYTVSGDVDLGKAGEYSVKVTASDSSGNISEKEYSIKVKEKPVVVSARSYAATGTYSYNVSGGVFPAPDPAHRAAINGADPGNCTWYVYNRLSQLGAPIPYTVMGNGGQWASYAQSYGYGVSKVAKAGRAWSTQNGYYGHVAFVEKVNSDGSIVVSEMNYSGLYNLTTRYVSASEAATGYYIDFGL